MDLYKEQVKRPWQSRTLWVNLIMAAVPFIPGSEAFLNEQSLGAMFLVVNSVLRAVTKSKITLK